MEEEETIQSYIDRSTESIDITVKMKRGSVKGWTQTKIIDFFKLRQRMTERIVVIDWNGRSIKQKESAEQVVIEFAEWRLGWYTTRFEKLLGDVSHELKYWLAMEACFKQKLPARLSGYANRVALEADVMQITARSASTTSSLIASLAYRATNGCLSILKLCS